MGPIFVKDKHSYNEVVEILWNKAIKRDHQLCVQPKSHQAFLFPAEGEPVIRGMTGGVTNPGGSMEE